jgi:hypothetical protein
MHDSSLKHIRMKIIQAIFVDEVRSMLLTNYDYMSKVKS